MLQVSFIRQQPDFVKERLAFRNFSRPELVDEILRIDENLRKKKLSSETLQASINSISKEVGILMAKGDKEAAENKKAEVSSLKDKLALEKEEVNELEESLLNILLQLPNIPNSNVPAGKTAEDNEEIQRGGIIPELFSNAKPHWDLIRDYDLINFETGVKLTGSGFPVYKGKGAKLQRALIQYFLDYNA
ncbi:MAG: serine--tRNA ligase, partial [Chitinophagaceae bacterium]